MRKYVGAGVVAAVGAAMLLSSPVSAKVYKLTAGSSHPPIVPWVATIKNLVVPEAAKRVAAAGKGDSIQWTEAYAGALYNFKNTLEGIETGLADIGWVGTLWEPVKMPLENVTFHAPFATGDVHRLIDVQEELHRTVPAMNAAWRRNNAVYLGGQVADSYHIVSKTPLTSVAELRGRKVLASGPAASWLKGTGATPVDAGLPLYRGSLESGAADAAIIVTTGILPFKLHEVAPHLVKVDLGAPISGALAMNLDTWKSLPLHMRTMFRFLGREYARRQTDIVAAAVREAMATLEKQGGKISDFPDAERARWAKLLPDLAGDWVARNEAKGLPAKKVLAAFMDGIRKRGGRPARNWDK